MPPEEGDDTNQLDQNTREKSGEIPLGDAESDKEKMDSEEESEQSATFILGDIIKRSKEKMDQIVSDTDQAMQDEEPAQEFQDTIGVLGSAPQETQDDPIFVKMKGEYEKIHNMFIQSRRNEKVLMKKCRELTLELNANASKVLAALKLSQNDRVTISSLKKETKKAWAVVESLNEREDRSKEAIANLKVEVESLKTTLNESGVGANMFMSPQSSVGFGKNRLLEHQLEQETTIRHLKADVQKLQEHLDRSTQEAQYLSAENNGMEEKIQSLIDEKLKVDEEILTLKDLLSAKKSEHDREIRAKEKLESALKQANEVISKKESENVIRLQEIKSIREQMSRIEGASRDDRIKAEKMEQENDHINTKVLRLHQDYEEQTQTILRLMKENNQYVADIGAWEEEFSKQKDEIKLISRARDSLSKRLKVVEEAKTTAEVERDTLKARNSSISHDIDALKKEADKQKKEIESLTRERDVALKNLVKAAGATQKQFNIVKLSEQTHRNLEQEINGFKDEAAKMRKLIFSLEKERDIKILEAANSYDSVIKKDEELKLKDLSIFDSKKKIIELERKMKEQQLMYESVRTDRNMYSKNLIESQDEVVEMKRKLKIMSHQIEQLKEEIATKENALIKEHFEHTKLEKEKESLSSQIAKVQYQFEESQQMIQNQQAEERKLRHIISEADVERLRQKKEYGNVIQERDILGTQLIRRNDELSLLYEKIKIQASTLNKGEIQYRERLEDIRVLKLEIKKLRREKAILQTETQNAQNLRSEIFRLQREVLRERTRVKVLEEELESPMNIHRWRKLSGSDPSTFELITKIQTLQKRLIAKTEEVVEKELVIQQKEKLYKDIKDILQRQPGPEVLEELRVVKEAVKVKVRESKALASELNMYQSQINEYKFEIERLNREIQDLKKKYFDQRKMIKADNKINAITERMKEKLGTAAFERLLYTPANQISYNLDLVSKKAGQVASGKYRTINPQLPNVPKFSGGGFNMTAAQRIHPVNTTLNTSRPESSSSEKEASGISGKEIQQEVEIRGDSAAVQVPQTVTEQELEKDVRSQTEASIAV